MSSTLLACASHFPPAPLFAAQVLAEEPDGAAGKAAGGISGLMVGAMGCPILAIACAALGYYCGNAVQHSSGLSEAAWNEARATSRSKPNRP
ncbi:hypothetical protein [Pseudomonas tohonis]|nr:hypothetical protein [Pseudomonas tohonis]